MPAGRRPASFGSLLGAPQPLPDDEPTEVVTTSSTADDAVAPLEPSVSSAAGLLADLPEPPKRDRPAETVRLNAAAARALWEAYQEALAQRPGMSYRTFASHIVTRGLRT